MIEEYRIVRVPVLLKIKLEQRATEDGVTLSEYLKAHFDEFVRNGVIEPVISNLEKSRVRGVAEKL